MKRLPVGQALVFILMVSAMMWLILSAFWKEANAETYVEGVGIVCDTARQMEEAVALMSVGKDVEQVSALINEKEDDTACGMLHVVFVQHETVKTVEADGKRYDIVRISLVLIVVSGQAFPAGNLEQHILLPHQGYDA